MRAMTRAELALLAERRIWSVLILNTDGFFAGVEKSIVRDRAQRRIEFLDRGLAAHPDVSDKELDLLPTAQRDRAFGEAAIAMHSHMQMIKTELMQGVSGE